MERGYETCETGLIFLSQAYLRAKKALLLAAPFFNIDEVSLFDYKREDKFGLNILRDYF